MLPQSVSLGVILIGRELNLVFILEEADHREKLGVRVVVGVKVA